MADGTLWKFSLKHIHRDEMDCSGTYRAWRKGHRSSRPASGGNDPQHPRQTKPITSTVILPACPSIDISHCYPPRQYISDREYAEPINKEAASDTKSDSQICKPVEEKETQRTFSPRNIRRIRSRMQNS